MGIDVRLENEMGDEIETLLDFDDSLRVIALECEKKRSGALRFIDPYGNSVFNRLQMPFLIAEIERACQRVSDPTAKKFADGLIRLARRCVGQHGRYAAR